jgi:ribose transport system permease protein
MNIQTKPKQRLLGRVRVTQQEIVFVVFAVLFGAFSALLPGFLSTDNMLTLLQNVAVLGILGLAMAIVVLGRGIDISLIAALAVPPGLVLQMVQGGHSLIGSIVTALLFSIAFGLINGWLIAYAEVPSLFATLATGLFLAGFGQAALFSVDVVRQALRLGEGEKGIGHQVLRVARGKVAGECAEEMELFGTRGPPAGRIWARREHHRRSLPA